MQGSTRDSRPMWIAAAGIGLIYVGSTLLTPLYPIYRRQFHFSELIVTAIYAVYVIGNLAVLFFFGRLSDQIGRRAASWIAVAITAASALLFLCAQSVAWLFPARILNGFAAGLGAGALTAWIAELEPAGDRARAAVIASVANLAGLSAGSVLAGLLARTAPWPLRTSFVLYLAVLVAVTVSVAVTRETVQHPIREMHRLSLRPRIGIPKELRLAFVAPAAMAFASFALGGFYAALTPGLLETRMHQSNVAVIGGVVGAFFGSGAVVAGLARQ